MEHTVQEHVRWILEQIAELESKISATEDPLTVHHLKADMRSLNLALNHYQLAMQIESDVAQGRAERKPR